MVFMTMTMTMMTEQSFLITPPPELVNLWMSEDAPWDSDNFGVLTARPSQLRHIATQAARWGADQELDACCEWIQSFAGWGDLLRSDRRPKLKEQALVALNAIALGANDTREFYQDIETIKTALETLPDD